MKIKHIYNFDDSTGVLNKNDVCHGTIRTLLLLFSDVCINYTDFICINNNTLPTQANTDNAAS